MKKHFRILFSIIIFILLTAQSCTWAHWISSDVPIMDDCNTAVINSLTHDASGNVAVSWSMPETSDTHLQVAYVAGDGNRVQVFASTLAANVTNASFRIDWQTVPAGVDELSLSIFSGSCLLFRDLQRPAAAPATPTATATATSTPTATATYTPTPTAVLTMNCNNLRLTSPLGGMANGMQTFYWDALPNALGYSIYIYYAGTRIAAWDAPAGQLNLTVDVSTAAIGGETPLTVELVARDAGRRTCSQSYIIAREAAPAQQGAPIVPTATPCRPLPSRPC